jgi:hypothetical protein
MKRTQFDPSKPIAMVWRKKRATKNPWRFALWLDQRWFVFPELHFASKAYATRIAQSTLAGSPRET